MGAPVHTARFAPGVIGLIMDGERPARVPNNVIDELKGREHNGIIALPKKPQLDPRAGFRWMLEEHRRRDKISLGNPAEFGANRWVRGNVF